MTHIRQKNIAIIFFNRNAVVFLSDIERKVILPEILEY